MSKLIRPGAALAIILLSVACEPHADRSVKAAEEARQRQAAANVQDRDAGFAWAKKSDLVNVADCLRPGTSSLAFIQGCQAYVTDVVQSREAAGRDQVELNGGEPAL